VAAKAPTYLITGARGTVGVALCEASRARGAMAIGWDRNRAKPGDEWAAKAYVEGIAPSAIFHLAMPSIPSGMENEGWIVNEKWTADIAVAAAERAIPFVYVSTVMVYTNQAVGPFTPDVPPDETEGYGGGKRRGELAALGANPEARIARLGWQIGSSRGGNNMIEFLEKQQEERGEITASTKWLPGTSFVDDTANGLLAISSMAPGVYHIGSNTRWNFFEIASALNVIHGNRWNVRATEDFVYDQRLLDDRVPMARLEDRIMLGVR